MMVVKLKVDSPVLADYLRYLFPPDDSGVLKVSSVPALGKLLVAHVRESGRPVPGPEGAGVLALDLPAVPATQSLRDKFLYYSSSSAAALNLAASAVFDLDFTGYYRKGEALGLKKKDIIEAFILSRKLVSSDCFDALHKRVYRRGQKNMSDIAARLVRKAYYIDESIDTQGLYD